MGRQNIEVGYKALCDTDRMSRDERVISAANLLSITTLHRGVDVDIDEIAETMAVIAEDHQVDPDLFDAVLRLLEPSLIEPFTPGEEYA